MSMKKTSLALIASLVLAHVAPAQAASVASSGTRTLAAESAPAPRSNVRVIRIPRTSSGPTLSDEERYAVREAISKEARNFRGGDAIVITATAAVILLLGIILIILLT
jgi:hypothetical protein